MRQRQQRTMTSSAGVEGASGVGSGLPWEVCCWPRPLVTTKFDLSSLRHRSGDLRSLISGRANQCVYQMSASLPSLPLSLLSSLPLLLLTLFCRSRSVLYIPYRTSLYKRRWTWFTVVQLLPAAVYIMIAGQFAGRPQASVHGRY